MLYMSLFPFSLSHRPSCHASRSYRIDHWSLKFVGKSSGVPRPAAAAPSRSLTRATVTVVSCFFYCRFIISCRWSRDCKLSLGAHTSRLLSLSHEIANEYFVSLQSGARRTRCRASMFWEVHPPDVPTVHLLTSLRKKQTRALCWRKSTSAGRVEWLIQLWSRTPRYLLVLTLIIVLCKGHVVGQCQSF